MVSITAQNVEEHIRRNEQVLDQARMEQADDSYSDLDYLEGSDLERFEAAGRAAEAAGSDDEDELYSLTLPNPRQEEYHPDVSELSSPDDGVPSSGELPHFVRSSQAQVHESQIQELPVQQMASDSEAEVASEDSFEAQPSNSTEASVPWKYSPSIRTSAGALLSEGYSGLSVLEVSQSDLARLFNQPTDQGVKEPQEHGSVYDPDAPVSRPNSLLCHTPDQYWPDETYDPELGEHWANQRPPSPPFAPPYASVNDVRYNHTFDPNDYVFVKYDKKELFRFLNEYKEWHVITDRMYKIAVRPYDYPTQFANKNLHHPAMLTRKSGMDLPSGYEEDHMDHIIEKVWRRFGHYRHKNIYILIHTKLAMFCYPIDRSTCYNMTPRQAVWQVEDNTQIKAVYVFTPSGYWKWDVDHISQVIININKVVWKDWILFRKTEDKNVYHVFKVDKEDEFHGMPTQALNPIFWELMVLLGIEGKWLHGLGTSIQRSRGMRMINLRGDRFEPENKDKFTRFVPKIKFSELRNPYTYLYQWINEIPFTQVFEQKLSTGMTLEYEPEQFMRLFARLTEDLVQDPVPIPLPTQYFSMQPASTSARLPSVDFTFRSPVQRSSSDQALSRASDQPQQIASPSEIVDNRSPIGMVSELPDYPGEGPTSPAYEVDPWVTAANEPRITEAIERAQETADNRLTDLLTISVLERRIEEVQLSTAVTNSPDAAHDVDLIRRRI
ncbi:hypothetical protein PM082_014485 [Marasmius tenuissimus]|nr:hypothetical protein PM082_014485 [Marasmius tenuissimus]